MQKKVITDVQQFANHMRIPYFRGIFLRITLPIERVCQSECSIVNLGNAERSDSHWIAFVKRGNRVIYFDSFGNLRPPKELERYLANSIIKYTRTFNVKVRTIASSFVYSFYEWLTNLRTDIVLFNSVLVWNMPLTFTLIGKSSSPRRELLSSGRFDPAVITSSVWWT